jgi:hypothetical protein
MNNKEIQINNLTPQQVEMLDIIWACEHYEEVQEWQNSLSTEDRKMSESLFQMILLELVDENVNTLIKENLAEARKCLKKYML